MSFNKLVKFVNFISKSIVVISFTAIIVFLTIQVISRYVIKNPLIGAEELVNFFQVWMIFIGTSIAIHDNSHIRVDILLMRIKSSKIKIAHFIINLVVLVYSISILFYGCRLVISSHIIKTPALRWPMSIIFSALPICALFNCIYLVQNIVLVIKPWFNKRYIKEL